MTRLSDNRVLIEQILKSQDFDSVCRLSVTIAKLLFDAHACSLLFFDADRNELLLKESTSLTPHFQARQVFEPSQRTVRISSLPGLAARQPQDMTRTLTARAACDLDPELLKNAVRYGLTRWSLDFESPLLITDVSADIRHSTYDLDNVSGPAVPDARAWPCELADGHVGSALFVPFAGRRPGHDRAVLRLVRPAGAAPFDERDLDAAKELAALVSDRITTAMWLSDVLDLGAKRNVRELGHELVTLLQKLVNAKGCSLFLNTCTRGSQRRFSCIATTGLGRRTDYGDYKAVSLDEACYLVNDDETTSRSFTEWVVKHGQMVSVDDLYTFDDESFTGLERGPGPGKFSEMITNTDSACTTPAGPSIVVPLFLHGGGKVAGVFRVVGTRGTVFQAHERLFLFDVAQRLSKVLGQVRFLEVSEKLFELHEHPEQIMRELPAQICVLLGVQGCSVFRAEGQSLELAGTAGLLEGEPSRAVKYQIESKPCGWTAWVAARKKVLFFNSPEDLASNYAQDVPRHSDGDVPCEIRDDTYRFLAVPILSGAHAPDGGRVLGVIRAPRGRTEPEFVKDDIDLVRAFADRLALAFENEKRLRAVAELSEISEPEIQVKRALDILIDLMGFHFAAIHRVDPDTRTITMFDARADPKQSVDPHAWKSAEHSIESSDIHAVVLKEHRTVTVNREVMLEDPDRPMSAFLDKKVYDENNHKNLIRLFCPIMLGDMPFGTIEVGYEHVPQEHSISEYEKRLVKLIAGSCAAAFHADHLTDTLKRLHAAQVAIGGTMRDDSSMQKKLETFTTSAANLTGATSVVVFEYRADRFKGAAFGGTEPGIWKAVKSSSVLHKIVERKYPQWVHDSRSPDAIVYNTRTHGQMNFVHREGIASTAALPLIVNGETVGIALFNFRQKQQFARAQQHLINLMGEHVAAIIAQNRLMEEKTNLVGFAHHSLSDPLQSLSGFLDAVSSGVGFPELRSAVTSKDAYLNSVFAKRARMQFHIVAYMSYLVRTFLAINTPGSEPLEHTAPMVPGDLADTCRQAVEIGRAVAGEGREIHTVITRERVMASYSQNEMLHALINVITNAIRYSRSKVVVSLRDVNTVPEIHVEDDGDGIPEEDREAVFLCGYRVPGNKASGSGYGLFLTKRALAKQRFSIEAKKSDTHLGACFVVRLGERA